MKWEWLHKLDELLEHESSQLVTPSAMSCPDCTHPYSHYSPPVQLLRRYPSPTQYPATHPSSSWPPTSHTSPPSLTFSYPTTTSTSLDMLPIAIILRVVGVLRAILHFLLILSSDSQSSDTSSLKRLKEISFTDVFEVDTTQELSGIEHNGVRYFWFIIPWFAPTY